MNGGCEKEFTVGPQLHILLPKMLLPEAQIVLEQQPDFQAQASKNWLFEVCEKHGHIAIFGPKFHPELAAIELYWGACKRYTKRNCNYQLETLKVTVPASLRFGGNSETF